MQRLLAGLVAGLAFTLWPSGSTAQQSAQAEPAAQPAPAPPAPQPYDGGTVRFLTTSEQTGGRFAVVELAEQGGYLAPPHRHEHMDESFHVLDGVLRVTMAGTTVDHGPGAFVVIPRGVVHSQGSADDRPVRVVMTMVPGGFEAFFAGRVELARHTRRGEPGFEDGMWKLLRENERWIQPGAAEE